MARSARRTAGWPFIGVAMKTNALRHLQNLAIVALTFATITTVVRYVSGSPDVGLLHDKLAYWHLHKDSFDTLFFGSSRIYRGIDPTEFDHAMAGHGHSTRSFNFGVAGMTAHETNALIRRVLRTKPARLRWVVVELDHWDPVIDHRNRLKRRGILWHDLPETASALRSTSLLDTGVGPRADLMVTHVVHFLARAAAAGRGHDLLTNDSGPIPAFERRGFETFPERAYKSHPMRRRFLRELSAYEHAVATVKTANAVRVSAADYNTGALREQIAMIRRAGAQPVHIIPPVPRATPALRQLASAGLVPRLLAFNDPESYPELFHRDGRFDREHLTGDAAAIFSRRLAERFAHPVASH